MSDFERMRNLIFALDERVKNGELTKEKCEKLFDKSIYLYMFCDLFFRIYNLGERNENHK